MVGVKENEEEEEAEAAVDGLGDGGNNTRVDGVEKGLKEEVTEMWWRMRRRRRRRMRRRKQMFKKWCWRELWLNGWRRRKLARGK